MSSLNQNKVWHICDDYSNGFEFDDKEHSVSISYVSRFSTSTLIFLSAMQVWSLRICKVKVLWDSWVLCILWCDRERTIFLGKCTFIFSNCTKLDPPNVAIGNAGTSYIPPLWKRFPLSKTKFGKPRNKLWRHFSHSKQNCANQVSTIRSRLERKLHYTWEPKSCNSESIHTRTSIADGG